MNKDYFNRIMYRGMISQALRNTEQAILTILDPDELSERQKEILRLLTAEYEDAQHQAYPAKEIPQ